MPIEAKDGMDILTGGGIIGGLVTAVTTFGWYLRRERSETAKNKADVAISNATTQSVTSQSQEIEGLRKRIGEMDSVIVALQAKILSHERRINLLETGRDIANMHLENIVMCEGCAKRNKVAFEGIRKALDPKTYEDKDEPEHNHDLHT